MPCRDRIALSSSRKGVTFEAVLDGSIPVAVKCLKIPRGMFMHIESLTDANQSRRHSKGMFHPAAEAELAFLLNAFKSANLAELVHSIHIKVMYSHLLLFNILADVLPDARLQELALQQLALNEAGYFVHFHGISCSEDSIMLVYDYIEVFF